MVLMSLKSLHYTNNKKKNTKSAFPMIISCFHSKVHCFSPNPNSHSHKTVLIHKRKMKSVELQSKA